MRHLQPATCLYFKIEVNNRNEVNNWTLPSVDTLNNSNSWGRKGLRSRGHIFPILGVRETPNYTCAHRVFEVKNVGGTRP